MYKINYRACDIDNVEDTRVFDKYSKWTKFPDGLFPPFLLFALLNLFIATLSQQKLFMACLLCVHYTQITSFPYQYIMWILNQIYEYIEHISINLYDPISKFKRLKEILCLQYIIFITKGIIASFTVKNEFKSFYGKRIGLFRENHRYF